uniref:Uncharacterized protein n=1 Tax=Fagus sylvatica TaxID=28930 RepID=A0A2N9G674_FAGSY
MAPGSRGVGAVFVHFSGEDSDQTGNAIGEPRVPRCSWSRYLSNAPGLADQLVASRKDSEREGGSCASYFCKVPDLRKSELGLVRYGPANRGHRSVFGPFEGSFPIGIPASPDQLVASQEDSARKRGNVGGKIPELSAKPYFVGLFSRAWGELGFARYDPANGGRRNAPYAKGFDHNSLVSRPFLARKVSNRSSHHVLQNGLGAEYLMWRGFVGSCWLGPGYPVLRADTRENLVETRYPPLEKVGLALITAADKLPQYFQAHTVYLVTQYPVQAMFNKADFTGRIWKWGAKISALGVKYLPRTAIKGQVLADFVAEFAPTSEQNNLGESTPREDSPEHTGWWKVYVDGASNAKGSGTGVVIITPDETVIEQSIRLNFKTSNNEAEYEAVLAGLKSAKTLEARRLIVYCDSLLVASQINGEYMARDERMSAYLLKVQTAMTDFETVRVEQIGRNLNNHADALATLASVLSADFKRFIPIETLTTPSIDQPANYINTITVGPCWMDPYVTYLKEGVLPEQKKEAEIHQKESREIHEGICGSHTGGRSLAHRALTQGYWWPYMQKDAVDYVRKCDKCQRFSHSVHQPAGELQPLVSPWPFAQWGMDLVGPLPKATGNRRWLIVATDYFTKWVEAEPLANIRDRDSIKFVWKNIITRFGIPKTIISDNGTQFTSKPFTKYCSELGIKNVYSSPAYPQSNGQAEASNKTVTTPRRSTGETPFSLAYGSEAVIPLEIGLPTLRTSEWEPDKERSGSIPGSRLTRRKKRTSNDQVSLLPAATEKGIQQEHSTEVLSTRRPGPQKSFGQH